MNFRKSLLPKILVLIILNTAACAEWQTTPVTVDKYRGLAFQSMVKNQTLNPHPDGVQQPIAIDGPKGEGIIKSYRAPATDLRKGKENVEIDAQGRL